MKAKLFLDARGRRIDGEAAEPRGADVLVIFGEHKVFCFALTIELAHHKEELLIEHHTAPLKSEEPGVIQTESVPCVEITPYTRIERNSTCPDLPFFSQKIGVREDAKIVNEGALVFLVVECAL